MEHVGLLWNPGTCAVVHVRKGVQVQNVSEKSLDEAAVRVPSFDEGREHKFLGVLKSVMQYENWPWIARRRSISAGA